MQGTETKQINFYLPQELSAILDAYISSMLIDRSKWMRAILVENLKAAGVLSETGEVLAPYGEPRTKRGKIYLGSNKGYPKKTIKQYGFWVTTELHNAFANYVATCQDQNTFAGAMYFWILQELIRLGEIKYNTPLGRIYQEKIAA